MLVPAYNNFKLIAPIDNVPAGATGQLKRPDRYHVSLIFDNHNYEDFVFDVYDTEPAVWAAIRPHTVSPSLTDPPRVFTWRSVFMAAVIVVATLTVDIFVDCYAQAVAAQVALTIPDLINEYF